MPITLQHLLLADILFYEKRKIETSCIDSSCQFLIYILVFKLGVIYWAIQINYAYVAISLIYKYRQLGLLVTCRKKKIRKHNTIVLKLI